MAHSTANGSDGSDVAARIADATTYVHDPPLPQHLKIVALETFFTPLPPLIIPKPYTYTLTEYERTTADQVAERIQDADIVITTVVPIRAAALSAANAPRLRLVAVMASGVDAVDLAACAARGIRVLNSPNCNSISVAEHVVSLYLAARRSLFPVQRALGRGDWSHMGGIMMRAYTAGAPPRSCYDETVGIIGYGGVGQAAAQLFGALGMKVIVSGRRGETAAPTTTTTTTATQQRNSDRVPFDEVIQRASVLVVCCPLVPDTKNLIGAAEFAKMQPDTILINVARGGIVGEQALVDALRARRIGGAGVDVFDHEPATPESSPLVAAAATEDLNLIITGHTAWVSASTRANYQRVVQENVERFLRGTADADRTKA
ncbi:hypothetical protein HMPREF1624_03647 [Sporothrix schenckii ATCC 58251]|uniref:Glycerate dehydrogenase n=1 Tax=Sporothrix schenckii (strain ATCC 58251 / de Perez 2211183) TaxID=1391915 RepID=U7Q0L6_SPOS1|nr:hypothetical protein HMPREF1624_03647 [Sporothrix schenckii ATCC 58251]